MKKTAERNRRNGQYTHTLEKVCVRCGATKGRHEAEAPYANDDALVGPLCDGFKTTRQAKKEERA